MNIIDTEILYIKVLTLLAKEEKLNLHLPGIYERGESDYQVIAMDPKAIREQVSSGVVATHPRAFIVNNKGEITSEAVSPIFQMHSFIWTKHPQKGPRWDC